MLELTLQFTCYLCYISSNIDLADELLIDVFNNVKFSLQKIVVNPKQFLLWKVNKSILREHVLDEMYHAALNLSLRSTHEMEQHKEVHKVIALIKNFSCKDGRFSEFLSRR